VKKNSVFLLDFPKDHAGTFSAKNGQGWLTFFINKNILTKSFTLYNGNLVST